MENAELAFDAIVVTGEAVEVGEDGTVTAFVDGQEPHGGDFKAIETQHAEMLDGHAIYKQTLEGRIGSIEAIERPAQLVISGGVMLAETLDKDIIGGVHAMLDGVSAGEMKTSIPGPFPTS